MTPLQEKEFELFQVFLEVCKELNLTYYLVCGSALGTVKYQGFIPWDDDMDIAMPRKDYEIFIEKAIDYLPGHIFLQNYMTEPFFPQVYSKLRNSNTTFVEKSVAHLPINHGIYIDIFPLDGYPKNKLSQILLEIKKYIFIQMLGASFAPPQSKKSLFIYKIKRILGLHKKTAIITKKYDQTIKKYNLSESNFWCNHGNWQGRLDYANKEQYGKGRLLTFENLIVRVPNQVEKYLIQKYGDYMNDLPISEQVGHHYYLVLDINNSFRKKGMNEKFKYRK